jgi:nicotinamidase-related amidase
MANTLFTSEHAALLLIDQQIGTMELIHNLPLETVRRNTPALAKMAKLLEMPVVLTSSQETNVQGPLMSELRAILPDEFAHRIQRAGIVNVVWNDPNFKSPSSPRDAKT